MKIRLLKGCFKSFKSLGEGRGGPHVCYGRRILSKAKFSLQGSSLTHCMPPAILFVVFKNSGKKEHGKIYKNLSNNN